MPINKIQSILKPQLSFEGIDNSAKFASIFSSLYRIELFKDYELMDADPIISSALDIYSDESTVDNVDKMNC